MVFIEDNNFRDLIDVFELEASLNTAECTILSSLIREESRGAHQRNDFSKTDENQNYNINISLSKNKFQIEKLACKKLKDNLEIYINKTQLISDYKNKLIE
mgnify:CR=1 FL=1